MNKRTLTIIALITGIFLFLLAYGYLFRQIALEKETQRDLESQLLPLQTSLAQEADGSPLLATRQAELSLLESELAVAEQSLPSEIDSTEVLAEVVTTAAIHRVKLSQITARAPATTTLGGLDYRVLIYDITAKGELPAVASFLEALESGPIGSMTLNQVLIRSEATPTPDPHLNATPVAAPYRAQLSLKIYTRILPAGVNVPTATPFISTAARASQIEGLLVQAQLEKDWERAVSLLLVLRQLQPARTELDSQLAAAYVGSGQQQLAAGQYPQASQNFRAALTLIPQNIAAQTGLAQLAMLTPSPTTAPTETPEPTATGTPTLTPTPSATPMPYFTTKIKRSVNTRYPDLGCGWFGFYGKITDSNGYPVPGINVHLWAAEWHGVTTTSSQSGEYELYLDDHPKEETWFVQLFANGAPVSGGVSVDTQADCGSSQVELNWQRGY
ncbi:MAG: hypothetical protein U9Q70_05880 [Chloroflexota bacterium]|nr:hypothetical protein [Chloroflexota bacterium]